ncbi:MAG: histidine kinase [Moorea sp. SIO1F2]|uniref:Hpt domain-containing protein n=1 Tax=unclassified Moorena TaxID=2683338 RepID=UPI0013BE32C5|nr:MULTISPECIES: Hpt domain-containing protein [unclassified Moorena]NEO19563.1 histidine kinase [Moorena sp. SIO4A5]NEQ60186.1 histidine kinase [Moorena sp. SIO4A1]NET83997.1 histidine kinase [Moorena sp. SIO1F2]
MEAGNQQRILGYFIEEAKEHLETIEQGLLNLGSVVNEPETVNELFRAAHSVKGGAAMLGYTSIQKTAHRLEDSFKVLQENKIKVDQQLETLFLKSYDTLKALIDLLEGPFGFEQSEAEKILKAAQPGFEQLQNYLKTLVSGESQLPAAMASSSAAEKAIRSDQVSTSKASSSAKGKFPPDFGPKVISLLKDMLELFKQSSTPTNRQQLQKLCKRLAQLGAGIGSWHKLVGVCHKAIANPQNSYIQLAPLVIKELKEASDQLQAAQGNLEELRKAAAAIAPSSALQKLAAVGSTRPNRTTKGKEITIVLEPKAAAKVLIQAFDKPQLSKLVKLLIPATRASS